MRSALRVGVAVVLAWVTLTLPASATAQGYSDDLQRAVAVVVRHPVFASGLASYPGWTATAYDAQDRYGLWRVDLATAGGEPLGWAQVRLADERVFAWEADFGLEGEAYERAQETLLEFLRYDSEFIGFAGDVDDNEWTWIGYEAWRDTWIVHVERGADSVQVILRSDHAWSRSLTDLHIVQIHVPAVVAVEDWRSMRGADAIALAFTDPSVAAAVRGLEGWTTEVEERDRGVWLVRFLWEGNTVAETEVDLSHRVVGMSPP